MSLCQYVTRQHVTRQHVMLIKKNKFCPKNFVTSKILIYSRAGTFIHGCKSLFLRQQKKKMKKNSFLFVG